MIKAARSKEPQVPSSVDCVIGLGAGDLAFGVSSCCSLAFWGNGTEVYVTTTNNIPPKVSTGRRLFARDVTKTQPKPTVPYITNHDIT
jgi:hypothetical protein